VGGFDWLLGASTASASTASFSSTAVVPAEERHPLFEDAGASASLGGT